MIAPDRVRHPKKIVALFTGLLGVGGVQETGRLTAAALEEMARTHGWVLEILSLNDPPGKHTVSYGERETTFSGFGRAKVRFALSSIQKTFLTRCEGTALILAGHPHLAVPALFAQRLSPKFRTVVMSHGIEVWTPLTPRRLRALQKAAIVLAPSSYTARKIAGAQEIPTPKIRRLPWPLGPSFLSLTLDPSGLPLPRKYPSGPVILTVGRWAAAERYKGTDVLIEVLARLRATIPGLHLVAVGSGDDLPRLRRIAAERQVADQVHFLENLSQQELAACYANADVFALPSTGEGFGLVFLEAMAFAKPVVGVDAGGSRDLIRDGTNGLLIPPNDIDRLAQGLGRLLQDEPLRRRLGECGAAMVRCEYRFEAFRSALEEIVSDVMSNRA